MTHDEEIEGLPSASAMESYALCKGKFQAEQELPPLPESDDAGFGTRVHAALAGDTSIQLSADEEDAYDKCFKLASDVCVKVFDNKTGRALTEHRMFWRPWTTARTDLMMWIHGDHRLLILDYKCGRNDVTHADANIQLRTAAVLAWLTDVNPHATEVYVSIVQPFASPQVSIAKYTIEDLLRAQAHIQKIITDAKSPGAKRTPGEKQCMYCRAKGVCPELHHKALTSARQITGLNPDLSTLKPKEIRARVDEFVKRMSNGALSLDLNDVRLCEIACEAIKDEAKARLKDGQVLDGWKLGKPRTLAPITDVPTVVARLAERGVSREEAILMLKMSKEAAEAMLRSKTDLKGKALEAELEVVLKDCTTPSESEAPLERVK